jgi:glycosyltransferase involved in cell wall biosynthesis
MRIIVLPRDPNPYQSLLYEEMERLGARIDYLGELTASHTLNLLLLPLEVTARRIVGARLIHLHWVFGFTLPGSRRFLIVRRAAQVWFTIWLRVCKLLGMHLIWTAHNALPHEPVFANDVSARRALVDASNLVIVHSDSTLAELAASGVVVRRSVVVQHGPIVPASSMAPLRTPGLSGSPRRFLFFGRIQEYKGVDDLLAAFLAMPGDITAHLTVAGQCDNPELRSRLFALARRGGSRVLLRLERIRDEEVTPLLSAADVVALPFRHVSTSGSAILALSHGRPLIVPDLPALADLPAEAVLRYGGEPHGLSIALTHLARADGETLAAMSAAAYGYASRTTWRDISEITMAEMLSVLAGLPASGRRHRPIKTLLRQ